jgi:urease accessory protein
MVMLVADTYLGSLTDEDIDDRVNAGDSLRVVLDDTDRQRSRVRTTTVDGTDLGITVGRELRDEDVLVATNRESDDGEHLVVVELDGVPAVALSFDDVTREALPSAVALGHAVGNRHRDLAVVDERVLIRAEQDGNRLESLLTANLPDGVTTARTTVPPSAFDSDTSHTHASSDHSHTSSGHHADGHTGHSHEYPDDNHQHAQDKTHDNRLEDKNT